MSDGTQLEMEWAGAEFAQSGMGANSAGPADGGASGAGATDARYLSDEEILGIDPPSPTEGYGGLRPLADRETLARADGAARGDGSDLAHKERQAEAYPTEGGSAAMPAWMAAVAADPRNGGAARELWNEHQEFRAAFASPTEARNFVQQARVAAEEARGVADEARAIKELLPGGVKDIVSLREATQSVERIDAALFSGDARAQADVVAEMARVNPAAFRSMFAEAARVMAGLQGGSGETGNSAASQFRGGDSDAGAARTGNDGRGDHRGEFPGSTLRKNGEAAGTQQQAQDLNRNEPQIQNRNQNLNSHSADLKLQNQNQNGRHDVGAEPAANQSAQELRANQSQVGRVQGQPHFDAAAYAAFERSTNETVARDVRGSIADTLARVMPEGVAEGAARRIGEDIFGEVHRALAGDRALSEQVAGVLRAGVSGGAAGGPPSPNAGYGGLQFGAAEQARVAALVAGRAKQLVPSVARRVIGEWTSSVLSTARSKAARQAAASARVDIAAPGGSSDSMPLRAMSAREVNYASMSDEQILGM